MLYKKIKKLLITLLIGTLLFTGFKYIQVKLQPPVKITQQEQIDTTEFQIKEILNTNKLQSLEIRVSISIKDSRYNESNILKDMCKFFTSRELELSSDYSGLFSYDLSKTQFIKINNTYNIVLNSKDLELNIVQVDDIKTKETKSLILQNYNSQDTSDLITKMQEIAKERLNTDDNKDKALLNVKYDLLEIFNKVGIDLNKVNITIQ